MAIQIRVWCWKRVVRYLLLEPSAHNLTAPSKVSPLGFPDGNRPPIYRKSATFITVVLDALFLGAFRILCHATALIGQQFRWNNPTSDFTHFCR
jgi:hypothetical protein